MAAYDTRKWTAGTNDVSKFGSGARYMADVSMRDASGWHVVWRDTDTYPTRGKARTAAIHKIKELEAANSAAS